MWISGFLFWILFLVGICSAEKCFNSSSTSESTTTAPGITMLSDWKNLNSNCDQVPSIMFRPGSNLPNVLDLKNITTIYSGSLRFAQEDDLTSVTAKSLSLLESGDPTTFSELSIFNCPKLQNFQTSPTGVAGENITLTIANTGLRSLPVFTGKLMGDVSLHYNPELNEVKIPNVERLSTLNIDYGDNIHVSLPNLQVVWGSLTNNSPAWLEPALVSRQYVLGFNIGEGVASFDAPKLSWVGGGGATQVNWTSLTAFETPLLQVDGLISFMNNHQLKSIKLAVPDAAVASNFSFSLQNNTSLKIIKFSDIFVPSKIASRDQKKPVEFYGDVELDGDIDSIDASGFHFRGAFHINSSSKLFDCQQFHRTLFISGHGFNCDSEFQFKPTSDTLPSGKPPHPSTSPVTTAKESAQTKHSKIVFIVAMSGAWGAVAVVAAAFFIYRSYRKKHPRGKKEPTEPHAHTIEKRELEGGTATQVYESPGDLEDLYHELPAEFPPEYFYRGFHRPLSGSSATTIASSMDEHSKRDSVAGVFGVAITTNEEDSEETDIEDNISEISTEIDIETDGEAGGGHLGYPGGFF